MVYLCFLSGAVGVLDCYKFSSLAQGKAVLGSVFPSILQFVCLPKIMSFVTAQYRVNYFAMLQLNEKERGMGHHSAY